MATTITWFGHNAWSIEVSGVSILIDPFLNDSPTSPVKADAVKGKLVFEKNCSNCHKVGDVGVNVAPDISDARTKTARVASWNPSTRPMPTTSA